MFSTMCLSHMHNENRYTVGCFDLLILRLGHQYPSHASQTAFIPAEYHILPRVRVPGAQRTTGAQVPLSVAHDLQCEEQLS